MGISILGIIAVQLVWMNNAIKVKNELFDRSVNEALNNTVQKLEDLHNFGVVNKMVFESDSLHWSFEEEDVNVEIIAPDTKNKVHSSVQVNPQKEVKIIRQFQKGGKNPQIEVKVDSRKRGSGSYSYRIQTETELNEEIILHENEPFENENIFIVSTDTIISNLDSLYNISVIKIDSLLTSFDTFEFIAPDFSKRAQLKAGHLKRLANKAVSEISDWDVHFIDEEQVKNVLQEELQNRNVPIDFQYAIIKDSTFIQSETVQDSLQLQKILYH